MRVALALLIAFSTTIPVGTVRDAAAGPQVDANSAISTHDNATPAGRVDAGELRLSLWELVWMLLETLTSTAGYLPPGLFQLFPTEA